MLNERQKKTNTSLFNLYAESILHLIQAEDRMNGGYQNLLVGQWRDTHQGEMFMSSNE